jgi:hypothetical protein
MKPKLVRLPEAPKITFYHLLREGEAEEKRRGEWEEEMRKRE